MASESDNSALIEHFRQANSDLALSDLAILIHVRGLGAVSRQLMVGAVDAELQEVREVLEGVIRVADRKTVEFDRARALLSKLEVK